MFNQFILKIKRQLKSYEDFICTKNHAACIKRIRSCGTCEGSIEYHHFQLQIFMCEVFREREREREKKEPSMQKSIIVH